VLPARLDFAIQVEISTCHLKVSVTQGRAQIAHLRSPPVLPGLYRRWAVVSEPSTTKSPFQVLGSFFARPSLILAAVSANRPGMSGILNPYRQTAKAPSTQRPERDKSSPVASKVMMYFQRLVRIHKKPDVHYFAKVPKLAAALPASERQVSEALRALVKGGFLQNLPWTYMRRLKPGGKRRSPWTYNQYRVTKLGLSYDAAVPMYLNNLARTKKELEKFLEMRQRIALVAANKEIGGISHRDDPEWIAEAKEKYDPKWVRKKLGR
jgi:hypothetical protein